MSLTRLPLVRALRGTMLALACVAGAGASLAADIPARWEQRLEEGGVVARISIESLDGKPLLAGAGARLRVALSSATDGSALARLLPGVWMDSHDGGDAPTATDCQRRVARYARGTGVNPQALVDLNGYDVLALNADASVSVLDPRTQFAGKTSLRTTLALPGPGFDWAADVDDRMLWISVPSERAVVAADLVTLRSGQALQLPGAPGRVRVEPALQRAWVGVARTEAGPGGLAVLDPAPPHRQQWVALTGQGHVELAFDPSGWVAVTQRESNEVVFIDPTTLRIAHRERLDVPGAMPLNVVFDGVARRFIVAEARGGGLWAFDHRGRPQGRLALSAGIGPMAITPDGRWLLVVNPSAHRVEVVDLPAWQRTHQVPVSGRPFDVTMTSTYAYVRALDSEAVSLIALASLATVPRVQSIAMGERPPGRTPQLPLASPQVPMPDGMGSFVASPGDNAIYFYMEGMNAAAGSVSARGHQLRAVRVARRGLREIQPGVHEMEVVLPDAAQLVVALGTESPRTRMCSALALQPAPGTTAGWQLAWEAFPVDQARSRLSLQVRGAVPAVLPPTLELRLFQPGSSGFVLQATRQSEGRYSAEVPELAEGLWYVHPQTPPAAHTRWPYVSFLRSSLP